jgi:type IV pilus assembly protein PilC
MPTFVWKGVAPGGDIQDGELSLPSRDEVVKYLRKKRIQVQFVREKPKELSVKLSFKKKVSIKDLAVFTRQFSTMVNAGLPLVQCMDILATQCESERFQQIQKQVMFDVESGSTLAEALRKHPDAFDNLYVNMVEAGETGGILDGILNRLAEYIEKAESLRRKVKSAMTYPAVVGGVALMTTVFMLVFIIPSFANVFDQFGGELPLPTRIVMGISNTIKAFWWAMLLVIGGVIFGLKRWYQTEAGRMSVDRLMLKTPVFGTVILKASVARFSRTLGTLIGSGVPILTALEITSRTAGNKIVELEIMQTRGSIREGETIAAPLRNSIVFPPMVVQMISVGEETGALDKMLEKIAAFYDDEVNTAVETLTSVIEPIMIVIMGALVGGMVVSMYLPLFKLASVVSK